MLYRKLWADITLGCDTGLETVHIGGQNSSIFQRFILVSLGAAFSDGYYCLYWFFFFSFLFLQDHDLIMTQPKIKIPVIVNVQVWNSQPSCYIITGNEVLVWQLLGYQWSNNESFHPSLYFFSLVSCLKHCRLTQNGFKATLKLTYCPPPAW